MSSSATNTLNVRTTRHEFDVEHDGDKYSVVIHCNAKGKFIDDSVINVANGQELQGEGTEGEVREEIIEYIANNWDNLVTN